MKRIVTLLLSLALLLMPFAIADEGHTSSRDTLTIAGSSEPGSLNPFYTDGANLKRAYVQIFDQLFNYNEVSANIVPNAVESYEFDEDYLGITMKLREDIVFHNGVPATSEDLAYTFKYLSQNSLGLTMDYINFDDVTIIDEYTVHIGMNYAYSAMLDSMVKVSLIPKGAAEELGDDFGRNPVGSGPYKFVSWTPGDRIVMVANENYWKYQVPIKNLVYRFITERAVMYIELLTGGIDVALDPLAADVAEVMEGGNPDFEVVNGGNVSIYWVIMNYNSENEAMKNKNVRQAIAYAVNHEDLAAIYSTSLAKPVYSHLPSGVFGYNPEYDENPRYPYDPDKAKEILAAEGYGDGLTLRMITESSEVYQQQAEVLQNQLAKVGITLDIHTYDAATAADMTEKGNDYDITIGMVNINGDPVVSPFGTHYDPTKGVLGGRNKAKNAEDPNAARLNEYIQELKETFDYDARYAVVQKITDEMLENCWHIPTFQTSVFALKTVALQNYMKVVNYDFFGPSYFK